MNAVLIIHIYYDDKYLIRVYDNVTYIIISRNKFSVAELLYTILYLYTNWLWMKKNECVYESEDEC